MKTAFQWVKFVLTKLWRTVICTFCKRHIYHKDIDNDQVQEWIFDPNGNCSVSSGELQNNQDQNLDVTRNNNNK